MDLFSEERESVFRARLAADPPLSGIGQNMEIVANVPLGPGQPANGANDHDDFINNAADIELHGDHAFIGSYTKGLVIVNIASCQDPARPDLCKPFVEGVLPCSGGQFDIQLSPDANIAELLPRRPLAAPTTFSRREAGRRRRLAARGIPTACDQRLSR